ncbi:hypothetical protein ACHMW6_27875 [Pseudoduganella sp. UC29_106]|uniref:hypothetical protein n=1 Tax=Pseudoduganella sp. UC29_106 TaxID=3374553 RepID=UPI003757C573
MSTPDPVARLTPPRLSLASCVRAHVVRSTRECVRPLHDLLDESWQAMARDVFAATSDDARIAALE